MNPLNIFLMNTKITKQDLEKVGLLGGFLVASQIESGPMSGFLVRYQSLFGRGDPYPEITGYAATSFARLYDLTGEAKFIQHARHAADGLINFQNSNGSIPTEINSSGIIKNIVHVFDLSIIARGLLDVFSRTKEGKYLDAASAAIKFLRENYVRGNHGDVLNFDGLGIIHEFPKEFWINLKVIICLDQLYSISKEPSLLADAELLYVRLSKNFQSNGLFGKLHSSPYNRSHYHAYALYGLVNYYKLTGDSSCLSILQQGIEKLSDLMTPDGGVYANFTPDGQALISGGIDVPVSAQLAELLKFQQMFFDSEVGSLEPRLDRLESFLSEKMYSGKFNSQMKGGLPFLIGKRRLPYLVAWGVEFAINYFHDKYKLGGGA